MNSKQIARYFGVTQRTIYRWIEKGCPNIRHELENGTIEYEFDVNEMERWKEKTHAQ